MYKIQGKIYYIDDIIWYLVYDSLALTLWREMGILSNSYFVIWWCVDGSDLLCVWEWFIKGPTEWLLKGRVHIVYSVIDFRMLA